MTCFATTTTSLAGYATILSLSSTTNGTVSGNAVSPGPIRIMCDSYPGNASLYQIASTSTCPIGSVALFSYSSSSGSMPINSHIEDPSLHNYPYTLCMDLPDPYDSQNTVVSQLTDCNGYGTTLFSVPTNFATTGNVHAGDKNAYSLKRCLSGYFPESLTFDISNETAGFGVLSPIATTYATSNGLGTTTPFGSVVSGPSPQTGGSFAMNVSTYGNITYALTLSGDSLKNSINDHIIPAIGTNPQALVAGTEQFGVSADVYHGVSGTGSMINTDYAAPTFSYGGSSTTPVVIATGAADDVHFSQGPAYGSTFYIRFAVNISPDTPAGNYTTDLTAIVTAEF